MQDATTERQLIVLIDDDVQFLNNYRIGLRMFADCKKRFDIHTIDDTDRAITFVKSHFSRVALYVVDSMMPHGPELFSRQATQDGLFTGVALLRHIREMIGGGTLGNARAMVLTNVNVQDLKQWAGDLPIAEVLVKSKCPPRKLAEIVDRILSTSAATSTGSLAPS